MRRRATAVGLGLVVLALLVAAPAAGQRDLLRYFCWEELVRIPDLRLDFPIPVGCEVVDCCPGCPGPGPIDWRIRVEGQLIQGVELAFEGAPEMETMALEGVAKRDRGTVALGRGESVLKGLPSATRENVPVAFLTIAFDQAAAKALADQDKADEDDAGGGGDLDSFEIVIEQFLGRYVVNEYRVRYFIRRCDRERICDTVVQSDNRAADRSVILLDGHRGAGNCDDDRIYRSTGTARVGNVRSPASCNSEVLVFSFDDAVELISPATPWTDSCGDSLPAPMDPILQAPVSIWLAQAGTTARATNDLANANLLYNQNKTGISFNGTITDVSGNATAVATIGTSACSNVAGVAGSAFYTAGQLNVYYVSDAFTGGSCIADRNQVYIGTTANLGSLPHEFGHSFSLFGNSTTGAHTNTTAGFTNQNIMWGGGPGTRNHFSLGQAFRFNLDANSSLNINGVRTGATRTCQALTASATCPALGLDWARP